MCDMNHNMGEWLELSYFSCTSLCTEELFFIKVVVVATLTNNNNVVMLCVIFSNKEKNDLTQEKDISCLCNNSKQVALAGILLHSHLVALPSP